MGSQVQGEIPRLFSGQRRGCLNRPWPVTILMNILLITIDPSSGVGWRYRWRPALEHRTEPPKIQTRSKRRKKMTKDCEGYYHPLIQGVGSNESLPRPDGPWLNEHVIQPDSLNVAGFSECGWPAVFPRSHWQWHWDWFPLHILDFWDPVCLDAHLPGPGVRGEELGLPTGQETLTALGDKEGGGEGGGEWEGVGRRGVNGNFL